MEKRCYLLHKCNDGKRPSRKNAKVLKTNNDQDTPLCQRNVDAVRSVINHDRRLTIRMTAEKTGIMKPIYQEIMTQDMNMGKVCAKLPKNLSSDQKEHRQLVCHSHLEREPDFFLSRVITGDKSWVFEYDLEMKKQSFEWHTPTSPCSKKARMIKSKVKSIVIVFFLFTWNYHYAGSEHEDFQGCYEECKSL